MSATVQMHITPNRTGSKMKRGNLSADSTQIVGHTYDVIMSPPKQNIPNEYQAYVKRLKNEKGEYEGNIEFLDADAKGGENMTIRFLQNCPYLDKKHQILKGFEPEGFEEIIGRVYQGNTIVDIVNNESNALYLEFLANHANNGDNKNRPKGSIILFKMVNGKFDIQNLSVEIEQEKKIIDLKSEIVKSEELTQVISMMLGINLSYEINVRRKTILNKIQTEGILFVAKMEDFFDKIGNRFEFYLKDKQLEISEQSLFFSKTKTACELPIAFKGAKVQEYTKTLLSNISTKSTLFHNWIEIEKTLNNK